MNDPRLTPANPRVAHQSLRGQVTAERYTDGRPMWVCQPVASLYDGVAPGQWKRLRELVLHEQFWVLETGGDWAFGYAQRDGYVGYMRLSALSDLSAPSALSDLPAPLPDLPDQSAGLAKPSHMIWPAQSYLAPEPVLKSSAPVVPISAGTRLTPGATYENGRWSAVEVLRNTPGNSANIHTASTRTASTRTAYVPTAHLTPLGEAARDPVTVAQRYLGTPYLWGGNSGFGIDCSGLVQAALLACLIPCPGDADLQQKALGTEIASDAPLERGDLLFWHGHVALCIDDQHLIHANATFMAVTQEPIATACARIAAAGDGPVLARKRLAT